MNCSICFENITEEKLMKTNCNHCFHNNCMTEWLKIKNSCPLCRKKVETESDSLDIQIPEIQPLRRQQRINTPISRSFVERYDRFTNWGILGRLFKNRLDRQNEEFRRHFNIE
jgi:hypothetical protein